MRRFYGGWSFRRAFADYGWLMAVAAVVIAGLAYFVVRPPVENKVGCVVDCAPGIPPELADHQERAGLERGTSVGATASKALPRPDTLFSAYAFKGSPNWSGRGTCYPQAIILHVTGPGTMAGMAAWFNNPASAVSAHFGIGKQGEIHQYVEMGDASWNAGIFNRPNLANPIIAEWFNTGVNPNRCAVGIELLLAGPAEPLVEYPAMRQSLGVLLRFISGTANIPLDRTHVIGHYEIDAVNRATDPRCCLSIDDLLASLTTVAADSYCCKESYGGEFNITQGRWEWRPDDVWHWSDGDPVWRCAEGCP